MNRALREARPLRLLLPLAALVVFGGAHLAGGPDDPATTSEEEMPPAVDSAEESAPKGRRPEVEVEVDAEKGLLRLPAESVTQGRYFEQLRGAIEYVLVADGGKDYETLFLTRAPVEKIHEAFRALRLGKGRSGTEDDLPRGPRLRILVEYSVEGKERRRPVEDFIAYREGVEVASDGGVPSEESGEWAYTGSVRTLDPDRDREVLQCALTKSIVGLHHNDPSPLLQNAREEARRENIYKARSDELPPPGTPVMLVFERKAADVSETTRRVRARLTGRVQGVGFRSWTQREARRRELAGFVRNYDDGSVVAEVEGPAEEVDGFLKKLARGPRAAKVEKLERTVLLPWGEATGFRIER